MVLLFVRGIGDKMEAVKFKDRRRKGRKSVISAGRIPTTGKLPYGYSFDKRKHVRVINESEAENVKLIFGWSREGLSARSIAQRLNTRVVPSPTASSDRYYRDETRGASKWGSSQVQRIELHRQGVYLTVPAVADLLGKPTYEGRRDVSAIVLETRRQLGQSKK